MLRIRPIELFLIQFILYFVLWLSNDYLATYVSVVFGGICLLVLIVSFIVEWIEPSKVPRSYFWWMAISAAAPLLTALIYMALLGGELNWMG